MTATAHELDASCWCEPTVVAVPGRPKLVDGKQYLIRVLDTESTVTATYTRSGIANDRQGGFRFTSLGRPVIIYADEATVLEAL